MIRRAFFAALNVTLKLTNRVFSGLFIGGSVGINFLRGGRVL